jgi:L-fuconolactonase
MIIDTHVHYWEPPTKDRPHDAEGVQLGHELSAEKLLEDASAAGIDKIVQITPALMGFDNRYALEAANKYPDRIAGVFGRFDPFQPDIETRLAEFMAQKGMLGIRLTLHQPPFDSWLKEGKLENFLAAAEKQHVPIQIFAPFLTADMSIMADRYQGIEFLVDHTAARRMPGWPNRFVHWNDVLKFAELPNVWMKVSYFPEAAPDGEAYPFPTSLAKFEELYDHIGSSKMIWGSNYPPVQRACTYAQALDFINTACKFLNANDRKAILSGNFIAYMKKAGNFEI